MIIGVCGFSYTGSGAIVDLLREFENVEYIYDNEFLFPYYPDGLEDLQFHLTKSFTKYASGYVALERYRRLVYIFTEYYSSFSKEQKKMIKDLTDNYISDLSQVSWIGSSSSDMILDFGTKFQFLVKESIDRFLGGVYRKFSAFDNTSLYPMRNINLSIIPNDFDTITQKYVSDILKIIGYSNKKIVLLDQPFSVNEPARDFSFFDDPVAIVVDRDPRDLYLYTKYFLKNKARQIPTNNVQSFVEYYKRTHMGDRNDKSIIHIRFEEAIYEYERILNLLSNRLNLGNHVYQKKFFNPNKSVNNTNMMKKIDYNKNEINFIESELSEYIFPFEEYTITNDGEMFS